MRKRRPSARRRCPGHGHTPSTQRGSRGWQIYREQPHQLGHQLFGRLTWSSPDGTTLQKSSGHPNGFQDLLFASWQRSFARIFFYKKKLRTFLIQQQSNFNPHFLRLKPHSRQSWQIVLDFQSNIFCCKWKKVNLNRSVV